jgi:HK97 family phage major capsid protein
MSKSQWLRLRNRREESIRRANEIMETAAREQRALTQDQQREFSDCHQRSNEFLEEMKGLERQLVASGQYRMAGDELVDQRRAGLEDISHRPGGFQQGAAAAGMALRADPHFNDPDRRAFRAWLRGGPAAVPAELRSEMESAMTSFEPEHAGEMRALNVGTPSAGGYMVPQSFFDVLDVSMKFESGLLDACDYWDTDNGATAPVPSINDTSNVGERVDENGSVGVDDEPAIGAVDLATFMYSSKVLKFSWQIGEDSAFALEGMLAELLSQRITRALVPDLTTGDGNSKPRGILTDALAGPTIFPATTVGYTDLIDLEYSVDRAYRNPTNPKVGYMMNDSTLKVLRKITDDSHMPIFRSGSIRDGLATNREPDTLNGWPLFINQSMPNLGQGNKPILFGDFSKYLVRRVRSVVVFRFDQLFMQNLQLGLLAFGRFGGLLRNPSSGAMKYLTNGAS